jgi:hypothetical protein
MLGRWRDNKTRLGRCQPQAARHCVDSRADVRPLRCWCGSRLPFATCMNSRSRHSCNTADDDLRAPSSIGVPSTKPNGLTSGLFSAAAFHWARRHARRRGAEKGVWTSYTSDFLREAGSRCLQFRWLRCSQPVHRIPGSGSVRSRTGLAGNVAIGGTDLAWILS